MRRKLPKAGTLRTRSRFLWFRKTIGDEDRWWERARWEEEMTPIGVFGTRAWIPVRWLDEEEAAYANIDVYSEQAIVEAIAQMDKARRGK